MKVGTKELKNRLSYYLRRVRDGESVEVTDRGTVVAELKAAKQKKKRKPRTDREALEQMATEGLVTLPTRKTRRDFAPIKLKKPFRVSQLVIDDRR